MAFIDTIELRKMMSGLGMSGTVEMVRECLALGREGKPGGLQADDFSIRDLAEGLVEGGAAWVRSMDPRRQSLVIESASSLDTTAFKNVTSQILWSKILEGYNGPENLFSRLIPTIPVTRRKEKMVGVTDFAGDMPEVMEGMPYPANPGFGEATQETPETTKRGEILSLTTELIRFDETGQVLRKAQMAGEKILRDKEKRLIRVVIGAVNNYNRNGTTYNTYLTSGGWINDQSNPLVDWTDIEAAALLFADMKDPDTNEPIEIMPRHVLVSPKRYHTARMILNSTEVRTRTQTAAIETVSANPVQNAYELYQSVRMYQMIQSELSVSASNAAEYWFLGDLTKAFAYFQNWPLTPAQAPTNSEAEFVQDIVFRLKVSEMGVAGSMEPRAVTRNKN